MNTINLQSFAIRQNTSDKSHLLDKLESLGGDVKDFRSTSMTKLVLIIEILERAKDKVNVLLPAMSFHRVSPRFAPTREYYAFCKHDAVEMSLQVFSGFGLTAGFAAELNSRALSGMLKIVSSN